MEPYLKHSIALILFFANICVNSLRKGKHESAHLTSLHGKIKPGSMEAAIKFMMKTDKKNTLLMYDRVDTAFQYSINLTDENRNKMMKQVTKYASFYSKARRKSLNFNWKSFEVKNQTLYRWFKLFLTISPDNDMVIRQFTTIDKIYDQARVCSYKQYKKSRNDSKCSLHLTPDLVNIFSTSRNPSELKYYWSKFRDVSGRKMRSFFIKSIKQSNEEAKEMGFKDHGDSWVARYDSKSFKEDMAGLVEKIRPLYEQLHAYVRRKLKHFYKKVHIENDGPIPAHLLGNIQAQMWNSIFDIVNPYPESKIPNITQALIEKKLKPLDIFTMAQEFYLSIGLERMTPAFWRNSVIEKPANAEAVCSGEAFNLMNGKDFRIRMCTRVNEADMFTVYHEMGHIEYYMLYSKLPSLFQDAPNPGFHEAVGDSMTLSVSTLDYLQKSGLIEKNIKRKKSAQKKEIIAVLMKRALRFIPMVSYDYIIDLYRYGVYNGSIKHRELNKMWWKYRYEYQGVCPPVKRTEKDWDPGTKLHVAKDVEYMRYFVANIFNFQIHKYLCKAAGNTGPLHECSIYKNKIAGKLFRKVLGLGNSKHWKEVMKILSRNETSSIDAEPLLEYFQPLMEWLKKENKGHPIGWKSKNVMICPSKKEKNRKRKRP